MHTKLNKYMEQVEKSDVLVNLGLEYKDWAQCPYFMVSAQWGTGMVDFLTTVAEEYRLPVLLVAHPSIVRRIGNIVLNERIRPIEVASVFDYIKLQIDARCVISDSETVVKETAELGIPTILFSSDKDNGEMMTSLKMVLALRRDNGTN